MQIEQLFLESFGIYKSRRLEFGDGLQVVYGPNESGKTTLLAALRQTLFGMPHQSHYAFDGTTTTQARVRLADGRKISLTRKKTRGPGLTGEFDETREPLTPEVWERCLTGATAGLFENLFAISLRELSSGEESLKSAGLTEALFGMAIGGMARFRQLDETLQGQCEELFKPSGNAKKPLVNALSRDIIEAEKHYNAARFSTRDYTGFQEQIAEHEARAQRIRDDRDTCQRRDRQLERIESALPAWREAEQRRTELAALGPVGDVPSAIIGDLKSQCAKRAEQLAELDRLEQRVASPLAEAPLEGAELLPHETVIRQLADQVARVRESLIERDALSKSLAELEQHVAYELTTIQPGWTAADLHRVTASLAQRETVQGLSEEAARHQQSVELLKSRRSELGEQRSRIELELGALLETDRLEEVRDLLERAKDYRVEAKRHREVAPELERLVAHIHQQAERLASLVGVSVEVLGSLVVPLGLTVDQYVTRVDLITRDLEQARSRASDTKLQFTESRERLARFDRDHEVYDRSDLTKLRAQREVGWSLIAQRYIDGGADPAAIDAWTQGHPDRLVDLYLERIEVADLLADRLLANAARMGERQQLVYQAEQCEAKWAERVAEHSRLIGESATLEQEWQAEWPSSPFRIRTPREMAEWLKLRSEWLEDLKRRDLQKSEQTQRSQLIEQFEAELLLAFPKTSSAKRPDAVVRVALLAATELERTLTESMQSRERLIQELHKVSVKCEARDREQSELALGGAEIEARKAAFLDQLGLPGVWDLSVAARVVARLTEVQSLDQKRNSTQQRWQLVQQQCEEFTRRSQPLFAELGRTWIDSLQACDQILTWRAELDERRRLELEQTRLLSERSASEKLIDRLREQIQKLEERIEELRCGLPELAGLELPALLVTADRAESLRAELRGLDHQWQAHADGADGFSEQLRNSTLDEVQDERQRLARQMRERDEERTRELASAETVRRALQSREQETVALERGQQLEGLRAQLGGAVDRFVPLALARHLMEAARVRFEKTQQPQLLVEAGRIFEQLTLGEYVQLTRSVGQTTELQAIPKTGLAKTAAEMSTGTREQLYLAIRLAYLKQYSQRAEPLPLVMDDVLVNFDEDRAKQTLRVLSDFSQSHQILFLTCHRRMVELVQMIRPELTPIELKPGGGKRFESSPVDLSVEAVPSQPKRSSRKPASRPTAPPQIEPPSKPEPPTRPAQPVLFQEGT